ncbi:MULTISPECIES: FKBP-type peptidyl-prolyl cis-trans isomerase [unclassified Janibacter]|uniref:FKBP-type peptidyl-prolyl cis-trans isomerase n=1 Tax=unclassified Janibacter TaxID=2649294 RepID=UPI003CFC2A25
MKSTSLRAVAVLAAGALALTACGSDDANTDPGAKTLEKIEVSGGSDTKAPTVKLPSSPFTVETSATRVIDEGDGEVTTDKQIVQTEYVLLNGKDGKSLDDTYKAEIAPTFDLSNEQLMPGLKKALTGQKVGSRIVSAMAPADAFGDTGSEQLGIGATDTLILVADIKKIVEVKEKADGKPVAAKAGLPTVKVSDDKAATFTMPKGLTTPKTTIAQNLLAGDGDTVEKGKTIYVHYTGATLKNNKVFDSSVERGTPFSFTVGQGQVIKAWDEDLIGKKVGDRVLLIVPPADGYGKTGNESGGIKGTDVLVFVVDILGVA